MSGIEDPEGLVDQYQNYVDEWVDFAESDLSVENLDSKSASVDQLIAAYTSGGEDIDWETYAQKLEEFTG